ncbi:NAC domain-containing protein 7-like [Magnolia sinica]|uniref:NAC domain-containing protein 7-like n=1 Tax=Magnolia sinica TaxID=86752 RepID=UPI00265A1F82|nr:NAC domain-containing protein 7-like [Magnolia sinica]
MGGNKPNRAAKENNVDQGYWKATGRDYEIKDKNGIVIGLKKTLVYYEGKPNHGIKTDWIMQEWRIRELLRSVDKHSKNKGKSDMKLDDWVLCKIYLNRQGTKKQLENGPARKRPSIDEDINSFMENGDYEFLDQAHPGPSIRRSPPIPLNQPSNCRSSPVQLSGPSNSRPPSMQPHGPSISRFTPMQLSGPSELMSPPMQHGGPSNFRSEPLKPSGPLNFRAPPLQSSGSSNFISTATQSSGPWNVSFPHMQPSGPSNVFSPMQPGPLLNNFNNLTMPNERSDLAYDTDHSGMNGVHDYDLMGPAPLTVHVDGLMDPPPLANDWMGPAPLPFPHLGNNFPLQSQASFNQVQVDQYPNSQSSYFYESQIESGPFTSQEISNEEHEARLVIEQANLMDGSLDMDTFITDDWSSYCTQLAQQLAQQWPSI